MKAQTVADKLRDMQQWQADLVRDIADGVVALVYIEGQPYGVKREGEVWRIRKLREKAEYTVENTKCTCADSRFRGRVCKHIKGLQCLSS